MKNIKIESTPITDTRDFWNLHNKVADIYNDLMERLPRNDAKKLKELVQTVENRERLFVGSVEFNGRLYSVQR